MNKLRFYLLAGIVFLLLSWSDLSRYCRHQIMDWKFRRSTLKANITQPQPDTVSYTYQDDPDMIDFDDTEGVATHAESEYFHGVDLDLLAVSTARMDDPDEPVALTWETLADVKYKKKYNAEYDQYFDYPVFGARVKAFNKQKVLIKGYIIPLDVGIYALSKYPYAACFFCGGAGPETITGLTFAKPPKRYKTDDFVTLKGIFMLNDSDVNNFMYQLYAAEQAK